MSIARCRSIFFTENVRMDPKKLGGIAATRTSLVNDARYHAYVDAGLEAYVLDTTNKTCVRVAWNIVRDYELDGVDPLVAQLMKLEADAAKADDAAKGAKTKAA